MTQSTLDLALDYLTWHPDRYLFPIHAGKKTPPHISDNLKSASNDPEQIKKWSAKWPGCFWGLSHEKSGLIVVDVDRKPGKFGQYTYDCLDLEHGWEPTETNSTPSGGLHYVYDAKWFYKLGKHSFALGENGFGRDVDSPHYSLIPGQMLAVGGTYEEVSDAPVVTAPQWFLEYLGKVKKSDTISNESAAVVELDQPANRDWAINFLKNDAPDAIEGQNGSLVTYKVACELRGKGISEIEAKMLMEDHYNIWPKCDPIWEVEGKQGLYAVIEHAYAYANLEAPGENTAEADFANDPVVLTDDDKVASDQAAAARKTDAPKKKGKLEDYYAYLPEHKYLYAPTGVLFPSESVNATVGRGSSRKLDQTRAVHVATWCPGLPQLIKGKLVIEGGWIDKHDANTFNRYKPARYLPGDASNVGPWRDHLRLVYPHEADHIEQWFACRVQQPNVKINHALVLGGPVGIGKDSLLAPLRAAVGEWNMKEVNASEALDPKYNGFLESVVLRISEARDFGDKDRYVFYDHIKPWLASPPEVLSVADKYIKAHPVFNCTGIIITTNYKTNGLYLPADDRRHYVAWSDMTMDKLPEGHFLRLWEWYSEGGLQNVAQWLQDYDLSDFNPKLPPEKTAAFWEIVNANTAPEHDDLGALIDIMGRPDAVTVEQIIQAASSGDSALNWVESRNRRQIPRQLEAQGYVSVHNVGDTGRGRWMVGKHRIAIYAKTVLSVHDRYRAAQALQAAT